MPSRAAQPSTKGRCSSTPRAPTAAARSTLNIKLPVWRPCRHGHAADVGSDRCVQLRPGRVRSQPHHRRVSTGTAAIVSGVLGQQCPILRQFVERQPRQHPARPRQHTRALSDSQRFHLLPGRRRHACSSFTPAITSGNLVVGSPNDIGGNGTVVLANDACAARSRASITLNGGNTLAASVASTTPAISVRPTTPSSSTTAPFS